MMLLILETQFLRCQVKSAIIFIRMPAGTFRRYATSGAEIMGGDWIAPSVYNQFKTAEATGTSAPFSWTAAETTF
jgi:hypothetical protein